MTPALTTQEARHVVAVKDQDYRHVKTGRIYRVLHIGIKEDDLSHVVVYQDEHSLIWVRPKAQFEDGRFVWVPKFGEDFQD